MIDGLVGKPLDRYEGFLPGDLNGLTFLIAHRTVHLVAISFTMCDFWTKLGSVFELTGKCVSKRISSEFWLDEVYSSLGFLTYPIVLDAGLLEIDMLNVFLKISEFGFRIFDGKVGLSILSLRWKLRYLWPEKINVHMPFIKVQDDPILLVEDIRGRVAENPNESNRHRAQNFGVRLVRLYSDGNFSKNSIFNLK